MPGPIVQMGATIMCSHAGQVMPTAPTPRVTLSGAPAVLLTDVSSVAGCPFMTGSNPMPCVTIQWTSGATRVLINGVPPLLQSSSGVSVPNGTPPIVAVTQMRVIAQ